MGRIISAMIGVFLCAAAIAGCGGQRSAEKPEKFYKAPEGGPQDLLKGGEQGDGVK